MNDEIKTAYDAWLFKAREDELAGLAILKERRVFAPACFHFQQMAEKLLKGMLVFYKKSFPKAHDLVILTGLLEESVPEIKEYRKDIEMLDRYYIETRYPGDYPEFTLMEAEQAYEAAMNIKKFIVGKIKK